MIINMCFGFLRCYRMISSEKSAHVMEYEFKYVAAPNEA